MNKMRGIYELSKPKMSLGFVFVGICSYLANGGRNFGDIVLLFFIGIFAASGTNMITGYVDRAIDEKMARTKQRPVPEKRIGAGISLSYGILFSSLAIALSLKFSFFLGFLVFLSIFSIAFFYNALLKRRTAFSTIIGAIPGSMPAIIGAYPATFKITQKAVVLAFFLFLWQIPHFLLISLKYEDEYKAAGVPTIISEYGIKTSKIFFIISILALISFSFLIMPEFYGNFLIPASFLSLPFLIKPAISFIKGESSKVSRKDILYFITYMLLIFFFSAASSFSYSF